MLLSRRRFVGFSVVGAGGAVALLVAGQSGKAWVLDRFRGVCQRLLSPILTNAPTGPLSPRALDVLLPVTRAIAGVPVQASHYEDLFRWRAEHLRGYKDLYERFVSALDDRAKRLVGCDFVSCSPQFQQRILQNIPSVHRADSRWDRLRLSVLERDSLLFERYILRDILLLFSRTDAWVLLGYEARPGTPRGLERYTQAPRTAG